MEEGEGIKENKEEQKQNQPEEKKEDMSKEDAEKMLESIQQQVVAVQLSTMKQDNKVRSLFGECLAAVITAWP